MSEQENPDSEKTNSNEIKQESKDVIIQNIIPSNKWNNTIAICSIVITLILCVLNYMLWIQVAQQTQSIKESSTAAKNAVIEYHRANETSDNNYQLAKKQFDSTFNFTKSYDSTLIKREDTAFAINNTAYIQIFIDPHFDKSQLGVWKINYWITNITSTPIKIIGSVSLVSTFQNPPKFSDARIKKDLFNKKKYTNVNTYLIRESPMERGWTVQGTDFSANLQTAYEIGRIVYQNLVTRKTKEYRFIIKLTIKKDGTLYTEFLYNDNINSKEVVKK